MKPLLNLIYGVALTFGMAYTLPVHAESSEASSTVSVAVNNKLDINSATVEQLVTLKGLGKKKAAAIVEFRTKQGKISNLQDLLEIKGIGPKLLEKLAGQLKV